MAKKRGKSINKLSKLEKLFRLEEMDDWEREKCLMRIDSFLDHINCGGITNYDGFGNLVYENKTVVNSAIHCSSGTIVVRDRYNYRKKYYFSIKEFDMLNEYFLVNSNQLLFQILWYNK